MKIIILSLGLVLSFNASAFELGRIRWEFPFEYLGDDGNAGMNLDHPGDCAVLLGGYGFYSRTRLVPGRGVVETELGEVGLINAHGELRWKHDLGPWSPIRVVSDQNSTAYVLTHSFENALLKKPDTEILAFDGKSGRLHWKHGVHFRHYGFDLDVADAESTLRFERGRLELLLSQSWDENRLVFVSPETGKDEHVITVTGVATKSLILIDPP